VRSVLVTHADTPVGKRVVKSCFRDPEVEMLIALGDGPPPRRFERYLGGPRPRMLYWQTDIGRHRSVSDLFHSQSFRKAEIDTVVHIPSHGAPTGERPSAHAGIPRRVAETRLILQNCLRAAQIENLIALSSVYVYRLPPGNANRLDENSELDMDPFLEPDIRAWIDSDMMIHGEIHNDLLRVVLLRVPTVVATGGYVYFHPALSAGQRPRMPAMGFDPMCPLVTDRDVARAVSATVHSNRSGVFNISGPEAVPLRGLALGTLRFARSKPPSRRDWLGTATRLLPSIRSKRSVPDSHLRYGFTLDTRAAERDLGFRATDRICVDHGVGGALSLEAIPA
jgi:nucleoside-diphosphate-sugar epimerase